MTEIDWSAAAVTASDADPEIAPTVALIELVPGAAPLASPTVEIGAVATVPDIHVAELLTFSVLPSL